MADRGGPSRGRGRGRGRGHGRGWRGGRGRPDQAQYVPPSQEERTEQPPRPRHDPQTQSKEVRQLLYYTKLKSTQFRSDMEMQDFVEILTQMDPDLLLPIMCDTRPDFFRHGPDRFREIAQGSFVCDSDSTGSSNRIPLLTVVVPLLTFLVKNSIVNYPRVELVNPLYSVLYETKDFLHKVCVCIRQLAAPSYFPMTISWFEIMYPLVEYMRILLIRFHDAPEDEGILEVASVLDSLVRLWESKKKLSPHQKRTLDAAIAAVHSLINRGKQDLEASSKPNVGISTSTTTSESMSGLEMQPPGNLRPGGPRHDNDFENICEIRPAPTEEEILCTILPYLPQNCPGGTVHAGRGGLIEQHIDIHFRLLREDVTASLRDTVQAFKQDGGMTTLKSDRYFAAAGSKGKQSNLMIYRNAQITDIAPSRRYGMAYEITFDQPHRFQWKKIEERRSLWQNGKQLIKGSLVCLWEQEANAFSLTFAIVSDRDAYSLAGDRPYLSLVSCDSTSGMDDHLFELFRSKKPMVMIQSAGNSFFAADPVLQALQVHAQQASLPFAQYICQKTPLTAPPFPGYLYRADGSVYNLDLSVLLPPAFRTPSVEYILQHANIQSQAEAIKKILVQASTLDEAQVNAFMAALTQEFVLIQGPPGTGKSYVGIKVVQALLQNAKKNPHQGRAPNPEHDDENDWLQPPSRGQPPIQGENENKIDLTPILCVCYTNHALDQFLEGLHKVGVREIVRIGGRSKSEILAPYNLFAMQRMEAKTRSERQTEGQEYSNIERAEKMIDQHSDALNSPLLNWEYVRECCQDDVSSDFYSAFEEPTVKEDSESLSNLIWQISRPRRERLPHLSFHGWQRGDDIRKKEEMERKAAEQRQKQKKLLENQFEALDLQEADQSDSSSSPAPAYGNTQPSSPSAKKPVRPLHQLSLVWDPNDMTLEERQLLIEHWRPAAKQAIIQKLKEEMTEFRKGYEKIQGVYHAINLRVMQKAQVVGLTTSGMAMNQKLIAALSPKIVIVEEAAEVLEAHILTSLTRSTQHLIMIGDHQQLRPKAEVYELSCESHHGYDLDVSLFERLQRDKFPVVSLSTQRRMRPEIANLVRFTLYPRLLDARHVQEYPNVRGMAHNLYFLDHNHPETAADESSLQSKTNYFEAELVLGLASYLVKQQYQPDEIAIVTPYVGQLLLIRKQLGSKMMVFVDDSDMEEIQTYLENAADVDQQDLTAVKEREHAKPTKEKEGEEDENSVAARRKRRKQSRDPQDKEQGEQSTIRRESLRNHVRLATVDNFQGEEAKVIIVSLVRNNRQGRIGFLNTSNRINVLLSRAMHGMYLIGHANSLRKTNKTAMWREVMKLLDEQNLVGPSFALRCGLHPDTISEVTSLEEFEKKAKDGGCALACDARLPCGHQCQRRCHPDDRKHQANKCMQKCMKMAVCKQHACTKLCYEDCGECETLVDYTAQPCGHKARVRCKIAITPGFKCTHKVKMVLERCNHEVDAECHQLTGHTRINCKSKCGAALPCGHQCEDECHTCYMNQLTAADAHHAPCRRKCDRTVLSCGHFCGLPCHLETPCSTKCEAVCLFRCEHSNCKQPCGSICKPCRVQCPWKCPHRGPCTLPCSAPCNRLPCDQRCSYFLTTCKHQCPGVCGEVCPSSDYCPQCPNAKHRDMIVDLRKGTKLSAHNPAQDPLIVLASCGHAFSISCLDVHFNIELVYSRLSDGAWSAPRAWSTQSLPLLAVKACPTCRNAVIGGPRRYNRLLNRIMLEQWHKNAGIFNENQIAKFDMAWEAAMENLLNTTQMSRVDAKPHLLSLMNGLQRSLPVDEVFKAANRQLKLQSKEYARQLSVLLVPKSDNVRKVKDLLTSAKYHWFAMRKALFQAQKQKASPSARILTGTSHSPIAAAVSASASISSSLGTATPAERTEEVDEMWEKSGEEEQLYESATSVSTRTRSKQLEQCHTSFDEAVTSLNSALSLARSSSLPQLLVRAYLMLAGIHVDSLFIGFQPSADEIKERLAKLDPAQYCKSIESISPLCPQLDLSIVVQSARDLSAQIEVIRSDIAKQTFWLTTLKINPISSAILFKVLRLSNGELPAHGCWRHCSKGHLYYAGPQTASETSLRKCIECGETVSGVSASTT